MRKTKRSNSSIRNQILSRFLRLLVIPLIMGLVTFFWVMVLEGKFTELAHNHENETATKNAALAHYSWSNDLQRTITYREEFNQSLDPQTCALGSWINEVGANSEDPRILEYIAELQDEHVFIHTQAQSLITLSQTDMSTAYTQYLTEFLPRVNLIVENINSISAVYADNADTLSVEFQRNIVILMITVVLMFILAVIASYIEARKTSKKISAPIAAVADWSANIASGAVDIDFSTVDISDLPPENEISRMITAFKKVVEGIKHHADAIARISNGDLTTYVDIRSQQDALGLSLYELVQSNDLQFSGIISTTSQVAGLADDMKKASAMLADNTIEQSASVEELSMSMAEIKNISSQNSEKVKEMDEEFGEMKHTVESGAGKMTQLVAAVEDIRQASDRIADVINTIDSIAFQTNILALNASVEAARAGSAGKGFAVVADEVRMLAVKSAQAAEETKVLIENSISKTHIGEKVAKETSGTFDEISQTIIKTANTLNEIRGASAQQEASINDVYSNISSISNVATHNAASCEETAASAAIMTQIAGQLRNELTQSFTLRQRIPGQPYIPPEKRSDQEFIRQATKNYEAALKEGRVGKGQTQAQGQIQGQKLLGS